MRDSSFVSTRSTFGTICQCLQIHGLLANVGVGGSRRDDHRQEEKAAKEVQLAGNYQVAKDFDPDDTSQPISAITCTPPGLRYNLVSKGATQARNTLEDPCIQTVMNICAPSYDPVVIVEVALKGNYM